MSALRPASPRGPADRTANPALRSSPRRRRQQRGDHATRSARVNPYHRRSGSSASRRLPGVSDADPEGSRTCIDDRCRHLRRLVAQHLCRPSARDVHPTRIGGGKHIETQQEEAESEPGGRPSPGGDSADRAEDHGNNAGPHEQGVPTGHIHTALTAGRVFAAGCSEAVPRPRRLRARHPGEVADGAATWAAASSARGRG